MQGITYRSCQVNGNLIALTFDDGPHPENSPKLLDILKKHGAKATFFVLGGYVEKYPELARRMREEGHEIGNHSWSHPHLLSKDFTEIRQELESTSDVVAQAIGEKPRVFRPPFIETSPTLENWIFEQTGLKSILLSVDSEDWKDQDGTVTRQNILDRAAPGAIVLAHERASTADVLDEVLAELKARGFRFVTVSELIANDQPGR